MCKMLISLESAEEMETLQKDVGCLCEAMLAFPLRFPLTRFYKGLQVNNINEILLIIFNDLLYIVINNIFNRK